MSFDLDTPECFLGCMMALEGIRDSVSIIHGPTGCKMYPADLSEKLFIDRGEEVETRNPFLRSMKYFFYQPRLPCTLLNAKRVILGSSGNLEDLYNIVREQKPKMIGILNSPGAALTGEDLERVDSEIPTVRIESHNYSSYSYDGYSSAAIGIVDCIAKEKKPVIKGTVNIIGLSLLHLRFGDSSEELKRMLSLCGIEVNAVLCAGSSVSEVENISSAELNIVIDEDYGLKVAEHLRDRFGTPYVSVMPVGFQKCEEFILKVCGALKKDPRDAVDDLIQWRKRTSKKILTLEQRYVRIGGRTFSVHSTPHLTESLVHFMEDYLGLVPSAIQSDRKTERFGFLGTEIPVSIWDTETDVVFGSGPEVKELINRHTAAGGVVIREPSDRPVSIIGRPIFGTMGTVHLTEDVLNVLAGSFNRM